MLCSLELNVLLLLWITIIDNKNNLSKQELDRSELKLVCFVAAFMQTLGPSTWPCCTGTVVSSTKSLR